MSSSNSVQQQRERGARAPEARDEDKGDSHCSDSDCSSPLDLSVGTMHAELMVSRSVADNDVGRTFGHNALKRLSFIFLPVMFTLGVISTLLMALAVLSVKNLAIGVVLLIVAVSQAVSRLFSTAVAPAPLVLHPRAELLPAPALPAPWPPTGPLLSPWGRSDNEATISD